MVPSFMLKKLYKKGSLRNAPEGLEFTLENSLSTVVSTKLERVTVDGELHEAEKVEVLVDGNAQSATGFSADTPMSFARGAAMTVRIKGFQADASKSHMVVLEATARGMGLLKVEIGDLINAYALRLGGRPSRPPQFVRVRTNPASTQLSPPEADFHQMTLRLRRSPMAKVGATR